MHACALSCFSPSRADIPFSTKRPLSSLPRDIESVVIVRLLVGGEGVHVTALLGNSVSAGRVSQRDYQLHESECHMSRRSYIY